MSDAPERAPVLEVSDLWWSRNAEVWLGWVVTVSDHEAIVRGQSRALKRRMEVAAAVRLYVEDVQARASTRQVAP